MNYFGTYHAEVLARAVGLCDAPRTCKGQMTIAAFETCTEKDCMAMIYGRMRNRTALARKLGCAPYASAAELALKAYRRWGDDYALHIEGPCMSCIADVEADRMYIVRDRLGECRLFYAQRQGEQLMFADHPDAVLKAAFIEPVMDREGLCELMGLGPARSPGKTSLKGLYTLEPGCMLICSGEGITKRRYFALATEPSGEAAEDCIAQVRSLLERAVEDVVPLHPAAMLSGGLDSTALTALLSMRIGRLDSFSVDYEGNERDFVSNSFRPEMDAPYIRMAVRAFGTRHRQVVLTQDELAVGLDRAMRFRGFPGMADIDSSLMLFARQILRHTPTVVSGECGDEVFGGYPWFRGKPALPDAVFPWSGDIELRCALLLPQIREKIGLRDYVRDSLHAALDGYDLKNVEDKDERALFALQRLCFDYFMPNLQERATAMCISQGLNVLTPLCDDRLVQYVYNVPWKLKFHGGQEKGLFREAMRELMPDKLRLRTKSPYPKTCSPAYTEAVRRRIRALIAEEAAPLWQIADRDFVSRIAASGLDPAQTPWYGQLMAGPQFLAYLLQVNSFLSECNVKIDL